MLGLVFPGSFDTTGQTYMSLTLIQNSENASANEWFVVRGYLLCKVEPVIGVI